MQLIPIYSLNSEPYFQRVPQDKLAVALNSEGWQQCPSAPVFDSAAQHPPQWVNGAWIVTDKTPEELAAEARKVWSSSAAFWSAFTDAEKLAILASTIAGIILLREELRLWTGEVWSDDSRVQAGLTGLVAVGILTNDRKAAILAK
jgi:hypothetical protein